MSFMSLSNSLKSLTKDLLIIVQCSLNSRKKHKRLESILSTSGSAY